MWTIRVNIGDDGLIIGLLPCYRRINAHVGTLCTCRFRGDQVGLAMLMFSDSNFPHGFAPKSDSLISYFYIG